MNGYPRFSVAFEIASTDADMLRAFDLYERALGAKKLAQFTPPGSDTENLHIVMEVGGAQILLHPCRAARSGGAVGCQLHFDSEEEVRLAYDMLARRGSDCSIGSWPHAPLSALVTDEFGVRWWLHT